MSSYVLAIDQGTTGSTALILDEHGAVVSKVNQEYRQIFPQSGWVEHNPEDIWESVVSVIEQGLSVARLRGEDIKAIGITNQRETTLIWDRHGGKPVHNAIVWQDRRTAVFCEKLKKKGLEKKIKQKTGLVIDPYFSASKIRWLLDHVPNLKSKAVRGEVCFGTVDSFLLWRLTGDSAKGEGPAVHATDVSNASRTQLMNLRTLKWDEELLKIFGIPAAILPEIKPSIGIFGYTKALPVLPDGIPVSGIAGDQQAALFGQACFEKGDAKCTFGTGSFLLMNVGSKPVMSRSGLISTVAWQWKNKTTYALEGSAFICGAAVQWLRDGLKIISKSSEIENWASKVTDAGGVQFVPALAGLGAPHWRPEARGLITGITRGSSREHLAFATLEGMALQNVELLVAMQKDLGKKVRSLRVDGGASANNLLMQMQADYLGAECIRPQVIETTSAGAAFMAGLGAGVWKSLDDVKKVWRKDRLFEPKWNTKLRTERLKRWLEAVERA